MRQSINRCGDGDPRRSYIKVRFRHPDCLFEDWDEWTSISMTLAIARLRFDVIVFWLEALATGAQAPGRRRRRRPSI